MDELLKLLLEMYDDCLNYIRLFNNRTFFMGKVAHLIFLDVHKLILFQ